MTQSTRKSFDPQPANIVAKVKQVKTAQTPEASGIQTNADAGTVSQADTNADSSRNLQPLRMPEELLNALRNPTAVLGFDIESHDELPKSVKMKSRIGLFWWRTALAENDLDQVRMVQIGWCFDEVAVPDVNMYEVVTAIVFPLRRSHLRPRHSPHRRVDRARSTRAAATR